MASAPAPPQIVIAAETRKDVVAAEAEDVVGAAGHTVGEIEDLGIVGPNTLGMVLLPVTTGSDRVSADAERPMQRHGRCRAEDLGPGLTFVWKASRPGSINRREVLTRGARFPRSALPFDMLVDKIVHRQPHRPGAPSLIVAQK